jgi:signal transduction histidine kinase
VSDHDELDRYLPGRRPPPLWLAVVVCVGIVVAMAALRLIAVPHKVLPIAYGVPLLVFVWLRQRALLWFTVAAFSVISLAKFFWMLPAQAPAIGPTERLLDFLIIELDLFVIAAVMHWLIDARDRIEQRSRELRVGNLQLEAINRELAGREEEVARQNEELHSQTEELERQTEELRVVNEELARREGVTETLLSLSRSLTSDLSREDMMGRICEVMAQLLGDAATAVAVVEQEGERLVVRCQQGFGADGPREDVLPLEHSFAALVLSRGRTAYVEDLAQRPDLVIPQPKAGPAFAAVLAAPLRAIGWPVGTLEVYRTAPGPWADDTVALVESVAGQTSISLEALQLFRRVEGERERLRVILQTLPVAILIAQDAAATRVSGNPALAAMYHAPSDANFTPVGPDALAIPRTFTRGGQPVAPEDLPLMRTLRTGQPVPGEEYQVTLPGARSLAVLISAAPFLDAAGQVTGGVGAMVEITAQKELQRELDTRRREAEEASVRKTRFLAAVSHDIRTPANAITLLAELIRRTASNPALASEVPELAQELHASALSLVELLGDVLDLARYDSGRIEMLESEFSLGELLDEEQRRFAPQAREKGLSLELVLPDVPPRLRADRIKLSRVIGNLVGNALKFTQQGGITVEAARDGDGSAVLRVRDTGIGVPRELQQQIFDEFVQLHNRERDRNKGIGLGLTICKRLVDAMGGRLSLVSEAGRGSTFTVTLPPTSVVA